ncbi:MAG: MlaD family protein [Tepidisphaeraceae bacterium]
MDDRTSSKSLDALPRPRVEKSRWPQMLVWIVPLLAAAALAYYLHRYRNEHGPEIRISFSDATGLRPGQTPVAVHGVQVGTVSSIALATDQRHAIVHVQLTKENTFIAQTSSLFWIVRPDVSGGVLQGFNTVTSGPYIEVLPGGGDPTTDFDGLEQQPILFGDGMRVVLHMDRLTHLQLNSPVNYRGIQVGTVQDIRFSDDTTQVNATLFIWKRFLPLVRTNSVFWAIGGTDVKGGVFSGLQLQIDSLRTLIAGGVEFATPDQDMGDPAKDGAQFTLHDQAKDEWLSWAPRITLPAGNMPSSGNAQNDVGSEAGLRAAQHVK